MQLQDGALNDEELNRFQIKCFHAPLQPTELAGVKEVVGERLPGVSTSISRAFSQSLHFLEISVPPKNHFTMSIS